MPNTVPNTRLVGAEWVNDYSYPFVPRRTNLVRSGQNALGFYNSIHGIKSFIYGDSQSWDQDIEERLPGTPFPSGEDDRYVEKVDIFFFSGHGNQDGLYFGVPDYDNGEARYDEIQLGRRGVIKWLVADACRLLEHVGVKFRWRDAFKGLRYILGFDGDSTDVQDRGWRFAGYLNSGETFARAWEIACLETGDYKWAYLRAGDDNSIVAEDKWMASELPTDDSSPLGALTYKRNIPPPSLP
jgi:hypothetical protein